MTSHDQVWFLAGQTREREPAREIPLTSVPFRIGRRADMDLVMDAPAVSNEHAQIIGNLATGLRIRDMHSTNGTYVNGERVAEEQQLRDGDWLQIANLVFRIRRQIECFGAKTEQGTMSDVAIGLIQFDRLLEQRAIVPFFQPIVALDDGSIQGLESLARSQMYGLQTADALFNVAGQLDLECELSRMCREVSLGKSEEIPSTLNLFLNTHPAELQEPDRLVESLIALRGQYPAQELTLEIHENAAADAAAMLHLRRRLQELRIRIAYDDFGSGQARLVQLAEAPPDFLKFDIGLIRGIDHAPRRRHDMLATLLRMVRDLAITALAEGVETEAEATTCRQLGFQLAQGFQFGRPVAASALDIDRG